MIQRKLSRPSGIRSIIKHNKLKTIIIETGDKNVYIPHEKKFIVTKEFLSNIIDVFCNCDTLETIEMENFDFSEIVTMSAWFWGCDNLSEIIFPKEADCNKLTDLYGCFSETTLDVIDLSFMEIPENNKVSFIDTFSHSKAQKIILPKCQIDEMSECFMDCWNLKELIAPITIDLYKAKSLMGIFKNCQNLEIINLSNGSFSIEDFVKQIQNPNNNNNLPDSCVIILPEGDVNND